MDNRRAQAHRLLLEIAHCPIAEACLRDGDLSHPCSTIVLTQQNGPAGGFQLPEPWSGDIVGAPVLFVSSNPSIGYDEPYPTSEWGDDQIIDFFLHRFGGGTEEWVREGRYPLLDTGDHATKPVAFWSAVRNRARELFEREVRPGIDYAMTEVVHCKSRGEMGAREAMSVCAEKYLSRTLAVSEARVIVGLGKLAADALRATLDLPEGTRLSAPMMINGTERLVALLPHPNARVPRTFGGRLRSMEVQTLKRALR